MMLEETSKRRNQANSTVLPPPKSRLAGTEISKKRKNMIG